MSHPNLKIFSDPGEHLEKEQCYLEARRREGRILSDEAVKNLPKPPLHSPLSKEWALRARSFERFRAYLSANRPLRILDLGCGNGWMSNRLAQNPQWDIWAVDLNLEELQQGARLFGRENLHFAYFNVLEDPWPEQPFDIILLAASIQYFPDLKVLSNALRHLLKEGGEIHVLDSPFYANEAERSAAQQRSRLYYEKLGTPEMASFYHHHLWPEARALGARQMDSAFYLRLLKKMKWLSPFPWLCFTTGSKAPN